MFAVGDIAYDKNSGAQVRVVAINELWGYITCTVFEERSGNVYKVAENDLAQTSERDKTSESYLRYVALLAQIRNEIAEGYLSTLSNELIPLPHQLHVLDRVTSSNNVRYILADEVGLGKTIEAGMVIKELKARGLIKRVLIVCPTGLVTQWSMEMQEKFDEKFTAILPGDIDTIKRITDNDDIYSQFDQVISPMDSIKPLEKRAGWSEERIEQYNDDRINAIVNAGWDLVVIDEAHRVAGSSSDVARHRLGRLLARSCPYLLLLSATPHSGKTEPFLRLVRLLDKDAFPNAKSIVREQVAPFLIRTEKREAIDNNGNRLFKERITKLEELHWDERHSMQRQLYEMVSEYVSKNYNKAKRNKKQNMCLIFLLIIMQRMVASSTAAVRQSLEKRLAALENPDTKIATLNEEDLANLDLEDGLEEATESISLDVQVEMDELRSIITVAKQAEFQHPDVKVERLFDLIDELRYENPNQKIIIFTEFVATQVYLRKLLESRGFEVSILNGSMSIEERNEALRNFKSKSDIFISTDAGGEGLNLQFANVVINYDMPWNPMKVEQRCGRVDRIGQKNDVLVFNFIVGDTVENRVREVLEAKLGVILSELGVDKYSDVLDSQSGEIDFTDVYMRSIASPNYLNDAVAPLEKEILQQVEYVEQYKDVIREDKDLAQLVGRETSFDVDYAVKRMLDHYALWSGCVTDHEEHLGINDQRIKQHLQLQYLNSVNYRIPVVGIEHLAHETGFFFIWELSTSDEQSCSKMLPMFINDEYILRPIAGQRILEALLNESMSLTMRGDTELSDEEMERLTAICLDAAYGDFLELKDRQIKQSADTRDKYAYALKLREEAAGRIGIDNVRNSRYAQIEQEKAQLESKYNKDIAVHPEFECVLMVKMVG